MGISFHSAPRPSFISEDQWMDWTWQMRNSLRSDKEFHSHSSSLPPAEKSLAEEIELLEKAKPFAVRATPYYASLGSHPAIRKIFLPHILENKIFEGDLLDPLGERAHTPSPRVIHRYTDRALLLVTDTCSVYCRFCTRKHFTAQGAAQIKPEELDLALAYLEAHREIKEVILSGGDPLTLNDTTLEKILEKIRGISHIEVIRIATRMPVVCPMRIHEDLVKMLRGFKPVFLMTHFNHPFEITTEAAQSLEMFVDNGVPVFNQMVLLKGINDSAEIVQDLSRRLLFLRCKPYYMFQMDPSYGSHHFMTSITDSLRIQKELWGHLSGLAMPQLSLDVPGVGGKIPLVPDFLISTETLPSAEERRTYRTFDGKVGFYVSPQPTPTPASAPTPTEPPTLETTNPHALAAGAISAGNRIPSGWSL